MVYAIRFDFPEGTSYAGVYKDAAGWAPTLKTALLFDRADEALTFLKNAYGESGKWARVIEIKDGEPA